MHAKSLKEALGRETGRFSDAELLKAYEDLSYQYRNRQVGDSLQNFLMTEEQRCAYLASRMPATFAAICHVLKEVRSVLQGVSFEKMLDLGTGPGTALWAAASVFEEMKQATLIEKDNQLIAIGERLLNGSNVSTKVKWVQGDITEALSFTQHDLVVLSYSIGELRETVWPNLLQNCFNAANHALVIVEPGTPLGFERMRFIRAYLLGLGAHMIAPCPHEKACPMARGDWCHFSERVQRSSSHRRIKNAELGYEDEKFSYLVVGKVPHLLPSTRILRHPLKRTGHVCLTLCSQEGVQQRVISKKTPEAYKFVRKAEWGQALRDLDFS